MTLPSLTVDDQLALLARGTFAILSPDELAKKIARSVKTEKPLVVKLGADPTAPDIHLGHTVILNKLRQFQDAGHRVVFIIGDFTARIGDPTGRDKTRLALTAEQIRVHAETYRQQVMKILDERRLEIVFNSAWLSGLSLEDVIREVSWFTLARLLEHNTFRDRFQRSESIRLHELLYPICQAYDSLHLKPDVELGGSDQTFNIVFGRDLMKAHDLEPQVAVMMPILTGTDGKQKMSKSLGNTIGIAEPPYTMLEKVMNMVDENIVDYYTLLTDVPMSRVAAMESALKNPTEEIDVRSIKLDLAEEIVKRFHGAAVARDVRDGFGKVDKSGIDRLVIPGVEINNGKLWVVRLIQLAGFAGSGAEARRFIKQGAVRINDLKIDREEIGVAAGDRFILRVGKNRVKQVDIAR